jgi:MazG family protein
MKKEYPQLKRFIDIVAKLRDPNGGCPWDLEQDHKSLTPYLIEEAYEYIHAIEKDDKAKMKEELGDVLLQVILHAQIAKDASNFDIEDVAKAIGDKMIYRHPHVFKPEDGNQDLSPEEVRVRWEQLKKKEKKDNYFFKEEDAFMPSLMAAQKIGQRSKRVNFDWENVEQVFDKVTEEYFEVKEEFEKDKRDLKKVREEIGDLLFSVTQLARHLDMEAEEVLRESNLKFIKRFNHLEDSAKKNKIDLMQCSVDELEELWQKTKRELKQKS